MNRENRGYDGLGGKLHLHTAVQVACGLGSDVSFEVAGKKLDYANLRFQVLQVTRRSTIEW